MAKTNGTNPYSGSPGEPRRSGRNRKHAHETGGVRKPQKKAVPKGQRKDPPELLTPMGTMVDHVTEGGRMEDNGQEGAV